MVHCLRRFRWFLNDFLNQVFLKKPFFFHGPPLLSLENKTAPFQKQHWIFCEDKDKKLMLIKLSQIVLFLSFNEEQTYKHFIQMM